MHGADKFATATEIAARDGRVIMFLATKASVDRFTKHLLGSGVRAAALHGDKSQPLRTRTLDRFRSGEVPVLVATNVAARGIHVDELDLVVNVDPPASLPTIPIGDASTLKVGQQVIANGSPLGTFTESVTSGILSATGRTIEVGSAGSRRTIAPRRAIRVTPIARVTVTTAGSPSGMAATASATATVTTSAGACPRSRPTTEATPATLKAAVESAGYGVLERAPTSTAAEREADTEQLRLALQSYRSFFQRLLST